MTDTKRKAAKKRRVPRSEWLDKALNILAEAGVQSITIDELSRRVGVAKTSFYWHFKNRDQLLEELLEYWEREFNEVATQNQALMEMKPEDRLVAISEMVCDYDLGRFEAVIAVWAEHDSRANAARQRAIKRRMDLARKTFKELGFKGEELEMRTRLMVGYQSFEPLMFDITSSPKTRRIRQLRTKLLVQHLTSK